MKTNEFITEASVWERPPGTELIISDSAPQIKAKLIDAGINAGAIVVLQQTNTKAPVSISLMTTPTAGDIVITAADSNGKQFNIVGSQSKLKLVFTYAKANRGEVAEGILGSAMFAKFINRNTTGIGVVTVDDIWKTIYSLRQSGAEQYTTTVKDSNKKIADEITFVLRLKSAAYAAITDPTKQQTYNDLAQSAVAYVNSSHAERYSKYFYTNGKADTIRVISDGVSGETEKKTDVELEIFDHKSGQMKRGKMSISLKAGAVKQFGQVGGIEFANMLELWGRFGIDVNNLKTYYEDMAATDKEGALRTMYAKIAEYIAGSVTGDESQSEYDLIKNVTKSINYFATNNDPSVSLVQFKSKGTYSVLRFNNLEPTLRKINLSAQYNADKAMPEIVILDLNSGQALITIRAKSERKDNGEMYVRNLIEKGPLLDIVAGSAR